MLSSLRNRISNARMSGVEVTLLVILLAIGLPMIVLIPPGAGYDEEDHLVRVWELSAASFIPGQLSPQELKYPTVFRDFAYRQQGSTGVIDSDFWQSYIRAPLYERGFARREIDTKSVYSPALLLPQAAAMWVFGRGLDFPVLPAFYLARLAGLFSYLFLTGLALRLLPFGKWILLVLAVSPIALFQAATLTPDTISNSIGFLFFAGCLQLTTVREIGWKEIGNLTLLIFLLFLAKLNLVPLILLPFLLIPPSRFTSKRLYVFLLAITSLLFVVEVAGWNAIASRNFDSLLLEEANPGEQIRYILGHPLAFLLTVSKDVLTNGLAYVQGWVNGYGYYYWTPPLLVSLLFLLSLIAVTFMDSVSAYINKRERIVFILVFLAGYVATIASLYVSYTPVGADEVFGVQGRYFIPLAVPLVFVLASFAWKKKLVNPSFPWVVGFLVTSVSLNLLGLYFSFHVSCGSTFYQTGLCYRPLFKDFPSNVRASQSVANDMILTQEIQVACNGLAEVRVLVNPSTASNRETTRFLVEDTATQHTVLDTSIANDQIHAETWIPLRFAPDWQSEGKQYMLKILGASDQGLQFFYTPQPEFNLGNSYENGQLVEEDIILQYGCVTGLRKLLPIEKP